MDAIEEKFEMWAKVDLFGHNHRVGKLSVVNTGVEVLYRLDTPTNAQENVTEFFGKGAVYSIMPMTEEAARLLASRLGPPAPISQYDLPQEWREAIRERTMKALPQPVTAGEGDAPDGGFEGDEDEDRERDDDDPDF